MPDGAAPVYMNGSLECHSAFFFHNHHAIQICVSSLLFFLFDNKSRFNFIYIILISLITTLVILKGDNLLWYFHTGYCVYVLDIVYIIV